MVKLANTDRIRYGHNTDCKTASTHTVQYGAFTVRINTVYCGKVSVFSLITNRIRTVNGIRFDRPGHVSCLLTWLSFLDRYELNVKESGRK